jgi:hypothetical protein
VAITLGLAVIVVMGTFLIVRGRLRAERDVALAGLLEAAEKGEADGDWARVVDRLDAALAILDSSRSGDPARVESIRARREAAGTQLDRRRREEQIASAEADLTAAESLSGGERPDVEKAMGLCERAFEAVASVADPRADRIREEVLALASGHVARRGVVFSPIRGTFLRESGAAEAHALALAPIVADGLRRRGYLPQPDKSALRSLWDGPSPYRLSTDISEAYGPDYLQSPHRTARIEVRLELARASDGAVFWQTRIAGRTRVPSPRMSAFESGYIGAGTRRDPGIERRLYDDAAAHLVEQLPQKLGNLPGWPGVAR